MTNKMPFSNIHVFSFTPLDQSIKVLNRDIEVHIYVSVCNVKNMQLELQIVIQKEKSCRILHYRLY